MKYLVMECKTGYAVLLDEEGRFQKAANLHYQVGETVEDPVLMRDPSNQNRSRILRIGSGVAALAACLILVLGLRWYQAYTTVYSSVFLSINPEVRLDLNASGTVVELEGLNEEGEQLLNGYRGMGKDKVTVSQELIDRAVELGFLSEGGRVVISIDTADELLFQEYGLELRTGVTEHLEGRIAVTLEVLRYQTEPETSGASTEAATETTVPAFPSASTEAPGETISQASSETPVQEVTEAPSQEPVEPAAPEPAETAAPEPVETAAPLPAETSAAAPTAAPPETAPPAEPAEEQNSDYGNSDYGNGNSGDDSGGGDSGYADNGNSPYSAPENSANQGQEGDSSYEPEDSGDSGYGEDSDD